MNFLSFQQKMQPLPIISVKEMEKLFPGFDRNSLTRWQENGQIIKLRNGFYRFRHQPTDQNDLFLIAGKICQPSYVSLESALSFYGLIPEGVFSVTSITTLKTQHFSTPIGEFDYKNLKKSLFFGARLEPVGDYFFKIADPLKAVLDLFYLRHDLRNEDQIEGLRLDLRALRDWLVEYPIEPYLAQFDSETLRKKAIMLQKMLPK